MVFIIGINLFSFLLMILDKLLAIYKKRRISEKTFIILSILGGSLGVIMGMITSRHKIKKIKFNFIIPLIFITQIILFMVFK